jgi:hypothetical protein
MNKTYKENLNMWALDTDADHILHRVGSDDYTPIRHTTAKDPDAWEEIAVADIPPYNEAEYKARVEELIRERYTASDEFALINNVMANVTEKRQSEYAAYQAYREDCKVRARAILSDSKCDITND